MPDVKILRVIGATNPAHGGTVAHIAQITPALDRLGHTTDVVSLDTPDAAWLEHAPYKIHALGPGSSRYGYSRVLSPWLKKHVNNYDCVLGHCIWEYPVFAAWSTIRQLKNAGHPTPPYFIHAHGMLDPWFKRTYPLKHLKKWLYWPWATYRVLKDADAVLFTCEQERLLARQSFWLYHCNEEVFSQGTAAPSGKPEEQRQAFLGKFPQLSGKRLIFFLSRIQEKKGCDLLLQAFAEIAGVDQSLHLVMAGPDQFGWQATLQKQANVLGIQQRITWTGMLLDDLKWGALHLAEVFILPSHQENFGIAVAEAIACGVPALISDQVNIWREIQASGAGIVAKDDLDGTLTLLKTWLHMHPNEQQAMRTRARACFMQYFEINQTAASLATIFRRYIEDRV